jgi:hypothetical protein
MTMPSKVTVFWREGNLNSVATSEPHDSTGSAHFIRADIAEELARAASKVTRSYRDETDGIISGMCELEDALARFKEAIEKGA